MRELPGDYDPQYMPGMQYMEEETQDFTKWRFDYAEMFREMEHELIGEIKTVDKAGVEKFVKLPGYSPMLTQEGAHILVSIARDLVNKITVLSGLEKNEILFLMRRLEINLAGAIFDNWTKWEMDKDRADLIIQKFDTVFVTLKHAQGSNTLNSLTKIEQIKRVYNEGVKKEGLNLNPFGGGKSD
jgi:hypothetical protein